MYLRMTTHLDEILARTRQEVHRRKLVADFARLETLASRHRPRGFAHALRQRSQTGPAVIAELKKASPSRGLIRGDFAVEKLATMLQAGGAAALSVLTEEHFFQGSLENLRQASAAVSVPCLRKDFMVDEFQVLEARAAGADAILLIVAALDDGALRQMTRTAHSCELDVLCEVHDAEEAARARDLGCDAIGVNNRNLKTLEVRLETSLELAERLPADTVRVAESGIHTGEQIMRLRVAGYHGFLVGESLMRHDTPGHALATLLAEPVAREVPA